MEENNNEEVKKEVEEQNVVKEAELVNTTNTNNQTQTNQSDTRNLAIASLVCSLVGLVIFRFPLAVAALITGIIAYNKEDVETTNSKGMAIAGIVIGAVDIVGGVFGTISLFSFLF